ncbi:hypothetical protein BHM03_00009063 [Ensete ventricosum]|nr:hypothetical protein BHM03_00009063 [Ensete ventricosum]
MRTRRDPMPTLLEAHPPGPSRRRMERTEPVISSLPNTPLNSTQTGIFLQIREKGLLKAPNPIKSRPKERDRGHYYRFHRNYDHDMEECYDLKNQIKDLIRWGHLSRYIRKSRKHLLHSKGPVEKQIDVIERDLEITFRSGKEEYSDHDDALVISARIANARVRWIMIDIGSSTNILYFDVFQKLGMIDKDLVPMTSTLTRFTGDAIAPLGVTTLPVTIKEEPRTKMLMVSFMVVKLPSAYNTIIGRPTSSYQPRKSRQFAAIKGPSDPLFEHLYGELSQGGGAE